MAVVAGEETIAPAVRRVKGASVDQEGRLCGLPVPSRQDFAAIVRQAMDDWFPGTVPSQRLTAALAARLALQVATTLTRPSRDLEVFGTPKSSAARSFLAAKSLKYSEGEFQGDFSVLGESGGRIEPVVVCESEAWSGHGTGYPAGLDLLRHRSSCGFAWDYLKVLHARAPGRLYVARTPLRRFSALEETLEECARTYWELWKDAALLVVLVPTADRDRACIRLGYGVMGGSLTFADLESSLRPWPSQAEFANQWEVLRSDPKQHDAFVRALGERDDYIWARYAAPLMRYHRGDWVALTINGDVILGGSRAELQCLAEQRFGPGEAMIARLDDGRGAERIGPRAA